MKILKNIFICLILFLIFSTGFLYLILRSTLPKTEGVLRTDKVSGKVEIQRNRWGVPFIKAEHLEDLFFAIGFVHAQDRLFQMELTRRYSLGRLSEIFGKIALDRDIFQKGMLVEESIEKSFEEVNPSVKKLLNSYAEGVNFFMEKETLPIEFKILRFKPKKWSPKDSFCVLKLMEGLLCRSGSEIHNFRIVKAIGYERAKKLIYGNFGESIIKKGELNSFTEIGVGSNNWVISGKLTDTGYPFLANDPHLPVNLPSYFYQIFAEAGKIELSGNTIPGAPFIVIGRNKNIGWGLTNVESDVIDYYILTVNPRNENQYLWEGEWRDFRKVIKKIKVKGEAEVPVEIKLAEFGRVERIDDIYFGVQSVMDFPSRTVTAFFEMNLSKNYEEFLSALKKFSSPAQNIVFADREGNIGYFPSGMIPVRSKNDGSIPVEAKRRDDLWRGFYEESKKPYLLNPEKGYVVTANNPVLPEGEIPIFSKNGTISFRADRIEELIKRKPKLTIEDMKKIQTDTFDKGAEFLIGKIKDMKFNSEKANYIMRFLKEWDFRMDKGLAPYLFYTLEYFLSRNIFEDNFEEKDRYLISTSWVYRIMNYQDGNEDDDFYYWIDDVRTVKKENFQEIVEKSLNDTYDKFKNEERKNLKWEDIHLIEYVHTLGNVPIIRFLFNRGPYFLFGGKETVNRASFVYGKNFKITASSSFRMIIDFSDFSNSLLVNSSGQSGNFLSKNYDDQIPYYVSLRFRKMEEPPYGKKSLFIVPESRE
ncbi:MAG: penicillin acylase family protein [Candidatus Aminicenantia bacterium]